MPEYIPCHLAPLPAQRVRSLNQQRITRVGLRAEITNPSTVTEFVSASEFHQQGAWFTIPEALKTYGPCALEVYDLGRLVAVVTVDSLGQVAVR
jgi:Lhr-like helicase